MRLRLPVLILAGMLVLATLFVLPKPLRIADIVLRSPIVLVHQAIARVLNMFASAPAPPFRSPEPAAVAPTDPPVQRRVASPARSAGAPAVARVPAALPAAPPASRPPAGGRPGSFSVPDRLRVEGAPGGPHAVQARRASGSELSAAAAANPAARTSAQPAAESQPSSAPQAPADPQPSSGIVSSGVVSSALQMVMDALVPPGGLPSPGQLADALPAGTVIGPDGIAQLPSGIQVPLGVAVPAGTGTTQIGPVQIGPVNGPIQIGPGASGSGSGPVSGGPISGGPISGGPIQIGPIQITAP